MIENQEFIMDFVEESRGHLETVEALLITREDIRQDKDSINEIFRAIHSIKGTAGLFGLTSIISLAHATENVLGEIRKGKLQFENYIADTILSANDQLKSMIEDVLNSESIDVSGMVCQLDSILTAENRVEAEKSKQIVLKRDSGFKASFTGSNCSILADELSQGQRLFEIRLKLNRDLLGYKDGPVKLFNKIQSIGMLIDTFNDHSEIESFDDVLDALSGEGKDVYLGIIAATHLNKTQVSDVLDISETFIYEMEVEHELETALEKNNLKSKPPLPPEIILDDSDTVPDSKAAAVSEPEKKNPIASVQTNISVNVQKLDRLMDLVGELVISETMVTGNKEILALGNDNFEKASRQHRKIITEIKEMVMSVRMVPLSATFHRMNRIVRDMSLKLGKEVHLEILGEETEVDKTIAESMADPLMHLVRNAIDHGLETPEERKRIGKGTVGKLTLEAKNSGRDVLIRVLDDGKGLDKEKIYEKAYRQGLTHKNESELTEKEIFAFIFKPGFSTKENATEFSGRGVGMDVVLMNIKKIGGAVDVESAINKGTAINIRIPLTLAIIDGMIIAVGISTYVLPTINIREAFRPEMNQVFEDPDGNEMILIRGECYPVVRLHKLFRVKPRVTEMSDGILVVVEDDNGGICLFADALVGEQQVVVKALPAYIKQIRGVAGCTLLGDGSISLIVEIGTLINDFK